jgi:hypothetical protein
MKLDINKLRLYLNNILELICSSKFYRFVFESKLFIFIKKIKQKVHDSILLFTIYAFWPTIALLIFRPLVLIYLGQWENVKHAHYILLLFSFLVSTVLALSNYLNKKGFLDRQKQNAEK